MNLSHKVYFIILGLLTFMSCGVTKKIPEGDSLITENNIYINEKKVYDISDYRKNIRTNENNKFLFFYPLGVFINQNISKNPNKDFDVFVEKNKKKANFIKKLFSDKSMQRIKNKYVNNTSKIKENFAEEPSLLNKEKYTQSAESIKNLFITKGYLNVNTLVDIETKDKKSKINYRISTGEPFTVDSIILNTLSPEVEKMYAKYNKSNKNNLKKGMLLNYEILISERKNLNTFFRNNGMFYFDINSISYELDTNNILKNTANLIINISEQEVLSKDSITYKNHKKYTISDINIFTNYSFGDSIIYSNIQSYKNYNILSKEGFYYSPKIITDNILFSKDELYSDYKIKETKKMIGRLNNFSFSDIRFQKDSTDKFLYADIYLSHSPKYWLNYEISVNRSNILEFGIDLSVTNRIRNLAKMTDIFEIDIIGTVGNYRGVTTDDSFLKSYIINTSLKWIFPTFTIPFNRKLNYRKEIKPRTKYYIGYSFQNNIGLDRRKLDFSINFSWNENEYKEHSITFPKINYTNYVNRENYFNFYLTERAKVERAYIGIYNSEIPENSNFEKVINTILSENHNDKKIYTDMISDVNSLYRMFTANIFNPSIEYKFTYNNKLKKSNWTFLKVALETSGNIFIPLGKSLNLIELDTITLNYNFLGIPTSKYFKTDIDFIKYWNIGNSKIAFRSFIGVGVPLGSTKTIPYEKMYFAGGVNSERAWLAYSLGPGGNKERIFSLNVADIKLSFSLEYRYNIYKSLKGGLFIDAGNIWRVNNINQDDKEELEVFKFNKFYTEFGIGIGNGFRYDFNFFVLRLDLAYKFYDPSKDIGDRFVLNEQSLLAPTVQFGITYPF